MIVDVSPVNVVDATAIKKFDQLREELTARDIVLGIANERRTLDRYFQGSWVNAHRELTKDHRFPTLKSAVQAFEHKDGKDKKRKSK